MTSNLFGQSPMSTLSASIRGGLAPGQLGAVMARRGVGKSALLVHIALGHLVRGTEVLHVSLQDQAVHVRSFYDEILGELVRASGSEESMETHRDVERNRIIHSYLSGPFTPDRLRSLLSTLDDVMHFTPTVVVIDGSVEASTVDTVAWRKVAEDAGLRIWVAVNIHREGGPGAESLADRFDTAVALEPHGNQISLHVLRAGGESAPSSDPLSLDPVTMIVQGEAPEHAGLTAPSPAPRSVTLVSGGTTGAECAFGEAAEKWGLREINLTFTGDNQVRTRGSVLLDAAEMRQGAVSMSYVQQRLKRSWARDGRVAKVLQIQWHLASRARQLFVIGVIQEDGTVTGGTGWSVELAKRWHKPVWVFCQERKSWSRWSGSAWVQGEPVIENTVIGATGTRFVSDAGKAAVEALFARSFGE
ncbi:MAG: hypothetical protein QGG40_09575 [Myxococcota bacterium]|jgi:hypothetical protein|nr:hypothetical protein [Myxococcota bacterium]